MRLIDADALLKNQELMNLTRCNGKTLLNEVIKEIVRIINEAPTIEPTCVAKMESEVENE